MEISYVLKVKLKKKSLPYLFNEFYNSDCEITGLNEISRDQDFINFEININAFDDVKFLKVINLLSSKIDEFKSVKYENLLEKYFSAGLINITSHFEIKSDDDYRLKLIGLYDLIENSASLSFTDGKVPDSWKTMGFITVTDERNNNGDNAFLEVAKQVDSVALNYFTGINAVPLNINFDLQDDFMKYLKSIEDTFSAIRLFNAPDNCDLDFYSQISDVISIPVLSRTFDEETIIILSTIIKVMKTARIKIQDSNIGFIGINSGVVRLASMLKKIGCLRVLGYDDDDRSMMLFERNSGLATTVENIVGNSEVVVFVKDHDINGYLDKMRPGLVIIGFGINREAGQMLKEAKSCKVFHRGEQYDYGVLFPALLKNMVKNDIKQLEDEKVLDISKMLCNYNFEDEKSIKKYIESHEKISKIMKS